MGSFTNIKLLAIVNDLSGNCSIASLKSETVQFS
jgi:hypothetical protein